MNNDDKDDVKIFIKAELLQKTYKTKDILHLVREQLPFKIWNKKAIRYVKKSVYDRYYEHSK